ncbi:Exostosin-2 [Dirofilaria immitis]
MRLLERSRLDGIRQLGDSLTLKGCRGNASVLLLFRTLSTILPACFLIFLCFISIAFILPSFLFNELLPQSPLHGPITFRKGENWERHPWTNPRTDSNLQETKRILASVRRDLLEAARQLKNVNLEHEIISKQMADARNELKILLLDIEDMELYRRELLAKNHVPLYLPVNPVVMPIRYKNNSDQEPVTNSNLASFEAVFDFSKCSIAGNFGIYIYKPGENASKHAISYYNLFSQFRMVTNQPNNACILFAFVDNTNDVKHLKYWNDGRNHVLLNVGINSLSNFPNSIIVSALYGYGEFKDSFDISLNVRVPDYNKNRWKQLSSLLPLTRKYLLSCIGAIPKEFSSTVREQLEFMASSAESVGDRVFLDTNCKKNCTSRSNFYSESLFALIFFQTGQSPTTVFHDQLLAALQYGAIPVITTLLPPLPFMEWLDWRRAVFTLPLQRLPELHFILRSFAPSDILEMRRQGRFLLENYLIDKKVVAEALIAALRFRIGVPGEQAIAVQGNPLFCNQQFTAPHLVLVKPLDEEYLGPREAPHMSSPYTHNYTSLHMYSYHWWNNFGHIAGRSMEYIINEPPFPSQFEYGEGLEWGFRPIAPPASGATFSNALGGNRPREQFTVVLLTYQRDAVLAAALERLNNMPYLNKVLVIWNGHQAPLERSWPRLHVPVIFINSTVNSLNNRFLPYKQINTEAVLSLDDDIDLRQHEIIFAFRVWREQRTKIVGFPARRHSQQGNEILYDSNHTCQLSMILTGAAFIHKAYLYAYTYGMPQVIREKVDEFMNCEDLAMNFLVSHITREPPIKTTSKWTLRCPTCKTSLYQRTTHYLQRHECIQFFTQVYGYNPLLFTQLRVDSVLFKTRLPTNHQKCFKYV